MKFYVFILLTALLTVSCSNPNRQAANEVIQKTVILDENLRRNENGEVIIDVNRLEKNEDSAVENAPNTQDASVTLSDSSQISTMFDGYGNRTDTRVFYKDAFINRLIIRRAVAGSKKAFLYANNGDVYILPENAIETALDNSARELRKSVNLNEINNSSEPNKSSQNIENPNLNKSSVAAAIKDDLISKSAAETPSSNKEQTIIDEKTVTRIQSAPIQSFFIREILNQEQFKVKVARMKKNKK